MTTLLLTVLVASLLGSLHCAGMCGPLVAFAVLRGRDGGHGRGPSLQFAYHAGRLATYACLGGLAGLLGAALDLGGSLVGLQRAAMVTAGVLMVGFGVVAGLRILGVRLPFAGPTSLLTRWLRRGHAAAAQWPAVLRATTIGLLTGLLPCGWLYAFVVAAAGTGHPAYGALTLLAFWIGTVPVLAGLGFGVQRLTGLTGPRIQLVASLLVVALGLVTLTGRWSLPETLSQAFAKPPTTVEDSTRRVESIGDEKPPCCTHER